MKINEVLLKYKLPDELPVMLVSRDLLTPTEPDIDTFERDGYANAEEWYKGHVKKTNPIKVSVEPNGSFKSN